MIRDMMIGLVASLVSCVAVLLIKLHSQSASLRQLRSQLSRQESAPPDDPPDDWEKAPPLPWESE
jgi:hypothetical protein